MVTKVLHQCTANIYRNFFNQSLSQQILRVAFPLIAVGIALHVYWRWTATTGPITKNREPTDIKSLDKFRSTEFQYIRSLNAIPCTAAPNSKEATDSLNEASNFFDRACDNNGHIRLWDNDDPRKLDRGAFRLLAVEWDFRKGKFFFPQEGKPVVVDCDTVCSPWCHEGMNRSALVFDYLMRAGHPETLLPEGAKNGHLCPDVANVEDAEDARYRVLESTTGFQQKNFRLGNKLRSEHIDLQQGFTTLFKQLATLNKPVMIFAFVSAVPILMREIMKRTEDENLSNITIVGFHHDDPMAVPNPIHSNLATADEDWVVENDLQDKLVKAQQLCTEWESVVKKKSTALKDDGKDENDADIKALAVRCKELSEQMAPLEQELLFHRRRHAVIRFQNEELAKLIVVEKAKDLEI